MDVETKRINLSLIDPNPFRDLINNPLAKDHVDRLKASIKSTGFWDGCQVRQHGKRYQLLFGHSRIEAARQMKVTSSVFTVRNVDDDTALRMMVDENVTQFGRDVFAVYKEATIAAACRIMLISLGKIPNAQQLLNVNRNDIKNGGCPGETAIHQYFKNTLSLKDIRLALQVFRDTGELQAWHKKFNPNFKTAKLTKPKLDRKAIARFTKTDHVKEFTTALKDAEVSYDRQMEMADKVFGNLGEYPGKLPSGREKFQTGKHSSERFSSKNIRRIVMESGPIVSDQVKRHQKIVSIGTCLHNISLGLARVVSEYDQMMSLIEQFGGLQPSDYMNDISITGDLEDIAHHLRYLSDIVNAKDTRDIFKLKVKLEGPKSNGKTNTINL